MATIPTPEESAKKIISYMVSRFNLRPQEVIRMGSLMPLMNAPASMRSEDLNAGLEFATEAGWIELTQSGGCRLTQLGFDAA